MKDSVEKVTINSKPVGLHFVLSDETLDRYGDIIEAAGWQLTHFKNNPVALFGHRSDFPIGKWKDVRIESTKLVGELELADEGTSDRIDELRRLVNQGILRAVSVGFRPLEYEPMDKEDPWGGVRYKKQELLETSLVSVPANPSALQLAKSMNISDETMDLVFGKQAVVRQVVTTIHGKQAETSQTRKTKMSLSKRIEDAQQSLNDDKDTLKAEVDKDEPDAIVIKELTDRIEEKEGGLVALKRAEAALAAKTSSVAVVEPAHTPEPRRPFAVPAKKVEPKDYVYRAIAVAVKSHAEKLPKLDVLRSMYGEDETTRLVFNTIVRAATGPALTTQTGWAAELVQTAIYDFIESLMPNSIYPALSAIGGRFSFGQNGIISLPSRSSTPTVAGSFVGQGAPIPVRQAAFTAVTLTPKKMAVITLFTREMAEHSVPGIEGVLRQAIQEDTSVAIDVVLLDNNAATTIRPAGLRNGVSVTTATAGGGFAALVGDLKALVGALITSSNGNLRQPVWIMNPVQAIAISLTQNAGGDFPFANQIENGTLQGYPVIQSSSVTAGMVILVDAADFFSATGDEPRFDVSDQAVVHQEDTTPLQIATGAQGSGVLATPTRSLWQTDTLGIRMILDMNWSLRRTGTVAWTQSVTW